MSFEYVFACELKVKYVLILFKKNAKLLYYNIELR